MRRSLSLSNETVNTLKAVKGSFEKVAHTKYSWNSFMTQLSLLAEINSINMPVKLERIGMWFGQAKCPFCKHENSPLKFKDGLVWGVTCSKCGKRFITVI